MNITYSTTRLFEPADLQGLFLSVQWSSGNFPDKLALAMRNSHHVVSAWDGQTLVALMNALADGVMTAYFHYLLVRPEYQSKGIGKALVESMLHKYRDYARKIVIAYDDELEFYRRCGFEVGTGKSPMFITFLTT